MAPGYARQYGVHVSIVLLAVALTVLLLLGAVAPRGLLDRLSGKLAEALTGIASGTLLASALLAMIPEGFRSATSTGGWFNSASSNESNNDLAGSATHDADVTELIFEPSIDHRTLGLAILVGFVVMLLLRRSEFGRVAHAAGDGLAIGSAAVVGNVALAIVVALPVVLHRFTTLHTNGSREGDRANERSQNFLDQTVDVGVFITPAVVLGSFAGLNTVGNEQGALVFLVAAGATLYNGVADTVVAKHEPETGRAVSSIAIGVVVFAAVLVVMQSSGLLDFTT